MVCEARHGGVGRADHDQRDGDGHQRHQVLGRRPDPPAEVAARSSLAAARDSGWLALDGSRQWL